MRSHFAISKHLFYTLSTSKVHWSLTFILSGEAEAREAGSCSPGPEAMHTRSECLRLDSLASDTPSLERIIRIAVSISYGYRKLEEFFELQRFET